MTVEPRWLKRSVVLTIHRESVRMFGGWQGIRDEGLLESALARPRNKRGYGVDDVMALAAAYAFGICGNHPFIDGNKRPGFIAMATFLACNDVELQATDAQATAAMLELASGQIDEDGLTAWLRDHCRIVARKPG